MYFLRGGLPWQGLKAATNKQKYEKIGEKKQSTPIKELCEGFPEEFAIYLNYVRKLGFEENPDYDFLRDLLSKVLRNAGEVEDGVYDWMLLNGGKGWEANSSAPANALQVQGRDRRERERGERLHHRSSQAQHSSTIPAPSAAVVRNPSKRKNTGLSPIIPGVATPTSAAAQVNVPVPSRRASGVPPLAQPATQQSTQLLQVQPPTQHPYANVAGVTVEPSEYRSHANGTATPVQRDESIAGYGRASPGMPATPAMSAIAQPTNQVVNQEAQVHDPPPQSKSFMDILLCRCG
jgi:casein kinase 1